MSKAAERLRELAEEVAVSYTTGEMEDVALLNAVADVIDAVQPSSDSGMSVPTPCKLCRSQTVHNYNCPMLKVEQLIERGYEKL